MNNDHYKDKYPEQYNLGFELGAAASYENYREKFGTTKGGSPEWYAYLEGSNAQKALIKDKKFKEYDLDKFTEELDILCRKYDVHIFAHEEENCYCKDIEFYHVN